MKVFYDHLICIEEIISELDAFDLEPEVREELIDLADQSLHHHTLNVILNHLPRDHHQEFVSRFYQLPYDEKLLDFLREKISDEIEVKIKAQADRIKKEILAEIKKSRHKS